MSTLLIIGIILLLIICISLVVILFSMNNKSASTKSRTKTNEEIIKKRNRLVIETIQIPNKIEQMNHNSLLTASKKVFESFKALDYANKSSSKLDKVEWHTWQVALIMAMIKLDKASFVPDNENLFHQVILSTNNNSLVQSTQRVVDKFNSNIDIHKSRDELSHHIFWSSKEVSILFYYMSKQ